MLHITMNLQSFLVVRIMYSYKCYTVTLGWRCPSNGHFRIFWCSKHFPGSGYICWSWKNTSPFQVWLAMWSLAWENRQYFAMPPLVSPQNVVLETSTEIPYWWRITSQIWVVFLIGRTTCEIASTNQKHYPNLVTHHQSGISVLISQTSFCGKT